MTVKPSTHRSEYRATSAGSEKLADIRPLCMAAGPPEACPLAMAECADRCVLAGGLSHCQNTIAHWGEIAVPTLHS